MKCGFAIVCICVCSPLSHTFSHSHSLSPFFIHTPTHTHTHTLSPSDSLTLTLALPVNSFFTSALLSHLNLIYAMAVDCYNIKYSTGKLTRNILWFRQHQGMTFPIPLKNFYGILNQVWWNMRNEEWVMGVLLVVYRLLYNVKIYTFWSIHCSFDYVRYVSKI